MTAYIASDSIYNMQNDILCALNLSYEIFLGELGEN